MIQLEETQLDALVDAAMRAKDVLAEHLQYDTPEEISAEAEAHDALEQALFSLREAGLL